MIYLYIAVIVLCLFLSAFFSMSEMSFSASNKVRLEHQAEEGDKKAKRALYITEHFDDALSTILVGNNLVNIASSSIASVAAIILFGEQYTSVATLIITVAVVIFGETVPKIIADKKATAVSRILSAPIYVLMILLRPITWIVVKCVEFLTRGMKGESADDDEAGVEELHTIIEKAEDEDVLDEDASELVSAAIDFADIQASEVMTARVDITAIDIDDDWEQIIEIVDQATYSRIPVFEGSIDHIIGVLSMNHFLKAMIGNERVDIRPLLLEPCYVYKTMRLPYVMQILRSSRQHLAVVTDEYGGTAGVVSLEDVLETLVGDIWDDTDIVEKDVVEHADGIWELDGNMPISDFAGLLDWNEEELDIDSETVGGWCIEMLGHFPKQGDSFSYRDIDVTVSETDERRVTTVSVKKTKPPDELNQHVTEKDV